MQYATLKEKISAEKAIRAQRYTEFEALTAAAHAAGIKAGRECRPIPMVICTAAGVPIECVDDGACGFAWIAFAGNTAFGRWAKKQGLAGSHYPSGSCNGFRNSASLSSGNRPLPTPTRKSCEMPGSTPIPDRDLIN